MYLLYGEETYLKENALKKIKKSFGEETIKGINYIMLDDSNIGELISQIETPAFGYEKKLIIAKNTKLFKTEGKRKNAELTQLRDKINDYIKNNVDFIIATPPCQGMSLAGKMDTFDERNQLIFYALKIIKKLKPKYILLENVPQLLKTKIKIKDNVLLIPDYIHKELDSIYNFAKENVL